MQLNRSTDYAIQMLLYLAKAGKTVSSSKLAAAMGVPVENVGVKATTTEHLGHEGREEGITAYATCLVCRI